VDETDTRKAVRETRSPSAASGEEKTRVLFVCVHNSARSQMAEAFLNHMAGDRFEAESAGLEPEPLNPLAVEVMEEAGIDISAKQAKSVFGLYKEGRLYDYVITVCEESQTERCPLFPGRATRLDWPFQNPAALTGSREERLAKTRQIRDQIRKRVEEFVTEQSRRTSR
jgi:arsenate reductase